LDVIPINWYLETDLHHGTVNWNDMKDNFIFTFSFVDGFQFIDDALQEIREEILWTPNELIAWLQPN